MLTLSQINARLVGWRVYLLAVLFALPDALDGLAGIDVALVLPDGWGARIAGVLTIARIVLPPIVKQVRQAAADAPRP